MARLKKAKIKVTEAGTYMVYFFDQWENAIVDGAKPINVWESDSLVFRKQKKGLSGSYTTITKEGFRKYKVSLIVDGGVVDEELCDNIYYDRALLRKAVKFLEGVKSK